MRIVRSWPEVVPSGRAHVIDDLDRFVMKGFDYRGLEELDDDVVLLEWDIAVDGDELLHFIDHAQREPDRPLAAPYKLFRRSAYAAATDWPEGVDWFWPLLHWHGDGARPGPATGDPDIPGTFTSMAKVGEPTCNGISFGLVYLPRDLLAEHAAAWGGRVSDTSFSVWHFHHVRRDIPICWHVHPVHLHHDMPTLGGIR